MRLITAILVSLFISRECRGGSGSFARPEVRVGDLGRREPIATKSVKGQPTMLIFWAPWCKVCQRELPLLSQFSHKEKPGPLRMVSVGFSDLRGECGGLCQSAPGGVRISDRL